MLLAVVVSRCLWLLVLLVSVGVLLSAGPVVTSVVGCCCCYCSALLAVVAVWRLSFGLLVGDVDVCCCR